MKILDILIFFSLKMLTINFFLKFSAYSKTTLESFPVRRFGKMLFLRSFSNF